MEKRQRQQEFIRNESLEELLEEINGLLGPVEEKIIVDYHMPRYPVTFVVGAPRSGTTLMMQWLAVTSRFAYPTNMLSRFYKAPYIGALIQQLFTAPEFNYGNEILDFAHEISFASRLGKTRGALAPNEFWYFWRRFTPNSELRYVDEASLQQMDHGGFVAELAAMESVFDKPLAMKGMILELNIPFLSSILDKVLFLFIKRHPVYNAQSLLESRLRFFGDRQAWYSVKPPEYERLKGLDPIEQVVGQVYFTNRAIEEGLEQIDAVRGLTVSYERFCADPGEVFRQLGLKLADQGYDDLGEYAGPTAFQSTNRVRLPQADCEKIVAAYKRFSGVEITP